MRRAALVLMTALMLAAPARAQQNLQLFEQEIEAGLLYNFLKYVEWPSDHAARPAVLVCLLGGDPFGGHLQPMAGRTVNQRSIEIRTLNGPQDMEGCSLLFVAASEKPNWPQLQHRLAGRDVLTVSDIDDFAESGGMIAFTKINSRIGVKFNVDAITAAHLTVESRLLRLASTVHGAAAD
jgi:hypothetical protein